MGSLLHRIGCAGVLLLAACAPQAPVCTPPAVAATEYQLYFGRQKPGGEVTDTEWQAFVNDVLSPRFPDGLTVVDARGRWRDPGTETTLSERSEMVLIVVPNGAGGRQAIGLAVQDYRRQFDQQSVLQVEKPVCATF
jgi:hypothetical protein